MLKFMYNGIKVDGKLYKAWYSKGRLISNPDEGIITIYARDYTRLPNIEGLNVQNDTDIMTDYFDSDKIRVVPSNKWYSQVHEAYEKQEKKRTRRREKRKAV